MSQKKKFPLGNEEQCACPVGSSRRGRSGPSLPVCPKTGQAWSRLAFTVRVPPGMLPPSSFSLDTTSSSFQTQPPSSVASSVKSSGVPLPGQVAATLLLVPSHSDLHAFAAVLKSSAPEGQRLALAEHSLPACLNFLGKPRGWGRGYGGQRSRGRWRDLSLGGFWGSSRPGTQMHNRHRGTVPHDAARPPGRSTAPGPGERKTLQRGSEGPPSSPPRVLSPVGPRNLHSTVSPKMQGLQTSPRPYCVSFLGKHLRPGGRTTDLSTPSPGGWTSRSGVPGSRSLQRLWGRVPPASSSSWGRWASGLGPRPPSLLPASQASPLCMSPFLSVDLGPP